MPELRASGRRRLRVALAIAREGAIARPIPWILELAAQSAMCEGRPLQAARLFGASEMSLKRFGDKTQLEDPFQSELRAARTACANQLGAQFAVEHANGAELTLPAAVDLCLEVLAGEGGDS